MELLQTAQKRSQKSQSKADNYEGDSSMTSFPN